MGIRKATTGSGQIGALRWSTDEDRAIVKGADMYQEELVEKAVADDLAASDGRVERDESSDGLASEELVGADPESATSGPPGTVHLTELEGKAKDTAKPDVLKGLLDASSGMSEITATRPDPVPWSHRIQGIRENGASAVDGVLSRVFRVGNGVARFLGPITHSRPRIGFD
jgi:hypothetical protein